LDKVRKLYYDSVVELHGLVAAYKLNGQLAQVLDFNVDMQRYEVQVRSGDVKKVKPQNVRFVSKYRKEMANRNEVRALLEEPKRERQIFISSLKKWNCVLPHVVAGKALVDWSKLEDEELRTRLLDSKLVSIDTLPDSVRVVYLSIPRKRIAGEIMTEDREYFDSLVRDITPLLEDKFRSQIYYMLPQELVPGVNLPIVTRAATCSFPLYSFLLDALVVGVQKGDSVKALRYAPQLLDIACAHISKLVNIFVHIEQSKETSGSSFPVKLSLPSRGQCDHDQIEVLEEIEKAMNIENDGKNFLKGILLK
jgi:hypothetical protein